MLVVTTNIYGLTYFKYIIAIVIERLIITESY